MRATAKSEPQRSVEPRRRRATKVMPRVSVPEESEMSDESFVEHPDGWYWVALDGRQQFGPFDSCTLARADRDRSSEEAAPESEVLREAETELGVADWIDAETGEPAEGLSPPHLDEGR